MIFHSFLYVYQRVLISIEPLSSMVHEFLKWMFPKMDPWVTLGEKRLTQLDDLGYTAILGHLQIMVKSCSTFFWWLLYLWSSLVGSPIAWFSFTIPACYPLMYRTSSTGGAVYLICWSQGVRPRSTDRITTMNKPSKGSGNLIPIQPLV